MPALVQWDLEKARLADVTGARHSRRVGVVRKRGVKPDIAVAADGDSVELDLLVVEADGIDREDVEVPLVARMALAIPGSAVHTQARAVLYASAKLARKCHSYANGPAAHSGSSSGLQQCVQTSSRCGA